MNIHEHVLTFLIAAAERGYNKKQALDILKDTSAFITLPDSIRTELKPTPDGELDGYRPLSHFPTGGAWMELPHGEGLKTFKGLEQGKFFIPKDAKRKAADDPTDIKSFVRHNKDFLKGDSRADFTKGHLEQDSVTDKVIQGDIAKAYIIGSNEESFELYGQQVKSGLAQFNKTNEIVSMETFREMVKKLFTLTSSKLWNRTKQHYPDITMDEIIKTVIESYEKNYSPTMAKNASGFIIPSKYIETLTDKDYKDAETDLLNMKAFNTKTEIGTSVDEVVKDTIDIAKERL